MEENKKLFKSWLIGYLWLQNNPKRIDFPDSMEDLDIAKKFMDQADTIISFLEKYDLIEWKEPTKN